MLGYTAHKDRTYEDFFTYTVRYPNVTEVEMDTVKGIREQGKRTLTILSVDKFEIRP